MIYDTIPTEQFLITKVVIIPQPLTDWMTLGGDTGAAGAAAETARRASAMYGVSRRHTKLKEGAWPDTHTPNSPQVPCDSVCVTQGKLCAKGGPADTQATADVGGVAGQRSARCLQQRPLGEAT